MLYKRTILVAIISVPLAFFAGDPVSAQEPALKPGYAPQAISAARLRKDPATARKLAKYRWVDKMALADPSLVASLCAYSSSATILASHPHVGAIADADHYFCRRLTRYRSAARALARNPQAYKVVARDPEGMYQAIRNDRSIARILYKNQRYDQMIVENPELGKMLARYM